MKKLFPVIIIIIAGVLGGAGGVLFKKSSGPTGVEHASSSGHGEETGYNGEGRKKEQNDKSDNEISRVFTFSRQFVVPIVRNDRPIALVILEINIAIDDSVSDNAYSREPILRDALLSELLQLAHDGILAKGASDTESLAYIKEVLLKPAQHVLGKGATDILILDIGLRPY
ncbi:MAG: hypothetical protein AAGD92_06940 [Pseudomonadota bacterium]